MSAQVVILGASGFIGKALSRALAGDAATKVIEHSSKTLDLTRPEALSALDAVAGPEATLVLASALTPDRGQNLDTLGANLAMATNVARALDRQRFGHVIYIGSDAVYGFDVNPVTETTPVAPAGAYGFGKYAGEKILEIVTSPRSIPLLILRVAGVYGPGDPHGSYGPNSFARSMAKDRTLRMFGFEHSLEAYVPKPKRIHGYFAMPLLAGGRLVGRVDPVRRGATLVARQLSLDTAAAVEPMARALREAAEWVGCTAVELGQVSPPRLAAPLAAALA